MADLQSFLLFVCYEEEFARSKCVILPRTTEECLRNMMPNYASARDCRSSPSRNCWM